MLYLQTQNTPHYQTRYRPNPLETSTSSLQLVPVQGTRIVMVRHGQTDWNHEHRLQGQRDIPLNATGRKQAQLVAAFLQDIPLELAFSSTLSRAQETAREVLRHHPSLTLQTLDELKEVSHGEWEGRTRAELVEHYPELFQQWELAPATVQKPGGETLQQAQYRIAKAWQHILRVGQNKTILVVAHQGTNRLILCNFLGLSANYFWHFSQHNCAVTVIDYPNPTTQIGILQSLNLCAGSIAA